MVSLPPHPRLVSARARYSLAYSSKLLYTVPAAIAEDPETRQLMLELRGEFGRDEEVEIEKVEGEEIEPIRRGRR